MNHKTDGKDYLSVLERFTSKFFEAKSKRRRQFEIERAVRSTVPLLFNDNRLEFDEISDLVSYMRFFPRAFRQSLNPDKHKDTFPTNVLVGNLMNILSELKEI